MPIQTGYFDTLKSVAGKVFTYLASITLTGTDGKTITVTADTSLDEAVAMSSKAPKTATIAGDGTAGRVLRSVEVRIVNGTTAATIKPQTAFAFNGDFNSAVDNLAKSGTSTDGKWTLDAGGGTLALLSTGITGDPVGIITSAITQNLSGTGITCYSYIEGTSIMMVFQNATTGAAVDLTTLTDTGPMYVNLTYITSA